MDLFSRTCDVFAAPTEALGVRRRRRELLSEAAGRVLEVGVGTGLNLPLYPVVRVTKVVATDPNPNMLWQARRRAAILKVPIQLLQAPAEALPFPDASFDTVVATLVFCSVDDPDRGLPEIRRVLRTGGRLLMFEHVRSPHGIASALQQFITPMTVRLAGGCHHDRDTVEPFGGRDSRSRRLNRAPSEQGCRLRREDSRQRARKRARPTERRS